MKERTKSADTSPPLPLRSKLMLAVFATIIPLNILIILFSVSMLQNTEQELRASAGRELESICSRVDTDISVLANRLDGLGRRLRLEFRELETAQADSVTVYTVWRELRESWQGTEFFSAAYLKTNWDGRVNLTHDPSRLPYIEMNLLKASLESHPVSGGGYRQLNEYMVEDKAYLVYSVASTNFSYGFIIQADTLFMKMGRTQLASEVLSVSKADGSRIVELASSEASAYVDYVSVSQTLYDGNFIIKREIPRTAIYQNMQMIQLLMLVVVAVTVFSVPVVWHSIRNQVLKPLWLLEEGMKEIRQDHLEFRLPSKATSREFHFMNQAFNEMAAEIGNLRIEAYEKEIERLRMEAINLRLQVNPHMLLNSLNMIYSLAESHNHRWIQEYTYHLMDYFRYALNQNTDMVPLEREMRFVGDYLEIQKIRYPNMLTGDYSIVPGLGETPVPPFMIQGFVENSVKHGMVIGHVLESRVSVWEKDGRVAISIEDNGAGMEPERLSLLNEDEPITDKTGTHIGIWNCRRRLKLFYGDDALFRLASNPQLGTRVYIEIPKQGGTQNDATHS